MLSASGFSATVSTKSLGISTNTAVVWPLEHPLTVISAHVE